MKSLNLLHNIVTIKINVMMMGMFLHQIMVGFSPVFVNWKQFLLLTIINILNSNKTFIGLLLLLRHEREQ